MRDADALIVGAGPAGASAALRLARAGLRVRLIDRARFPRPKLCGDTLNPGAMALLEPLGLVEAVRVAAVRLEGMAVTGPAGERVVGRYPGNLAGAAISRADLDLLLLRAAEAAGAEFDEGVHVLQPILDQGAAGSRVAGVVARRAGGGRFEVRAPVTIAADGRRSRLAFGLGLARHPAWPRRWAIGAYFEGVEGLGPLGEMHVRAGHYLGVAPLPGGLANACLVVPEASARRGAGRFAALLDEALAGDPLLRDRFRRARPVSAPAVLGPLAVDAVRGSVPGLLVCGDAAGFVDPMTGDGMRFALRGAELAAEEALRLAREGPAPAGRLAARLEAEFRAKRAFNRTLRRLVGFAPGVRAAALAARLGPGLVALLVRYAGDAGAAALVSRSTTPRAGARAA